MTGFSRVEGTFGDLSWSWELRSVNGKNLDLRLRLPHGYEALDPALRGRARQKLSRGNVAATLTLQTSAPQTTVRLNEDVLEAVVAIARRLAKDLDTPAPSVDGLLALKGVLETTEREPGEEERETVGERLIDGFDVALDQLHAARLEEGAALAAVISGHIDEIERLAAAAKANPERTPEAIRARLRTQIETLLDVSGNSLDDQRLHQEAALLATKADIQEELDRLTAHIAAARALLAEGAVVGRKFDFLAQEFNREVNTLCSKSNSVSLTAIGLELKAIVDQIREQVQNLE